MPQGTIASVYIDGTEVRALEGSVTTRLNGVGTASCRVPITEAIGGAGSMLKVYLENDDMGTTPVLWHHGRVLTCEDSADENSGYTVYNSSDPLELWNWRPVRDFDGDFSNPQLLLKYGNPADNPDYGGPYVIQQMLYNTMFADSFSIPPNPDGDHEGPHRLYMGTFEQGSVDLRATLTDWPMTMADLAAWLVSTGEVDIVITPIEFTTDPTSLQDNCYGQIDVYNGDYGFDLSSTVVFSYGMGAHNIRAFRRNEDMTRMVNKLWYYLGPKKRLQRWLANLTATDVTGFSDCGIDITAIQQLYLDSRGEDVGTAPPDPYFGSGVFNPGTPGTYDVRMNIQTFDDRNNEAELAECFFRRNWATEAWLRASPQTLVHITPTRDTAIGSFSIGDLVFVEIAPALRGGISGVQRVYEYTISWDTDSVPAIQELQVSSDFEGFTA